MLEQEAPRPTVSAEQSAGVQPNSRVFENVLTGTATAPILRRMFLIWASMARSYDSNATP